MPDAVPVLIAILGGVLPALAWLWFWTREDSAHPEPRRLLALAFLAGMLCVFVAIPLEKWAQALIEEHLIITALATPVIVYAVWSALEELLKFVFAYVTVLRRTEDDEPIDPVIYMVTVALGFAAAENTLFLLSPLSGNTLSQIVATGDFRFVGATLLHVFSSALIGVLLGLFFYARPQTRIVAGAIGLGLAMATHVAFNYLILNTPPEYMVRTFGMVWIAVIALLGVLEYIKRIRPSRT